MNTFTHGKKSTSVVMFTRTRRGLLPVPQAWDQRAGLSPTLSKAHLHRYLSEFDFRYNNREQAHGVDDSERTRRALKGAEGKRLMYRDSR